jgi:hypothetical protein
MGDRSTHKPEFRQISPLNVVDDELVHLLCDAEEEVFVQGESYCDALAKIQVHLADLNIRDIEDKPAMSQKNPAVIVDEWLEHVIEFTGNAKKTSERIAVNGIFIKTMYKHFVADTGIRTKLFEDAARAFFAKRSPDCRADRVLKVNKMPMRNVATGCRLRFN